MNTYVKEVQKISVITLFLNVLLSVLKFILGFFGNSVALIYDAIHSLSDAGTTIIVIIGARLGNKEEDDSHPYGHERIETMFVLCLSVILLVVGCLLFKSGAVNFYKIYKGDYLVEKPSKIALIAALVSILAKECMYRLTILKAVELKSSLLLSDAKHHRSDALSSVGSFIGIIGGINGIIWADSLASIAISLMIGYSGLELIKLATDELLDHCATEEDITIIRESILSVPGVLSLDVLKTRMFADKVYVDVEISVDATLSILEGHKIAEDVHEAVEKSNDKIKHCHVHVNPYME